MARIDSSPLYEELKNLQNLEETLANKKILVLALSRQSLNRNLLSAKL